MALLVSDGSLFFASVNNELGMNSRDVEALCDINRSTKPAQEGKIGKKGVGWKAVFAVSDQPTVLSGPFRFSFDVRRRGRLGYVTPDELSLADFQALPQLLQEASANTVRPATVLYLPLRGGPPTEDGSACHSAGDGGVGAAALIQSSMERLLRCPTWLLFLRQLRRVAWQDAKDSARPQNVSVERPGGSAAMIHKDVCYCICMYVEADCLLRLAVVCRGFVAGKLWEDRVQRFWPGLWEHHSDCAWPGLSSIVNERVAKMAFQALYAGTSGRVSPVDEAMARKVARGTETCAETPRNMVMFTLYHQGAMLGRSCSSISLVRAEALPSCLAAEKATFTFQVPSKLQELLDDWLYRFICNGRSINRQLLVSSEVSNPDVLQSLELSVVLQIWVWESGLRVLSPKMPLRLVSQDRQGFQLHFVHLPFAEADFSNCISLMIETKTATAPNTTSSKEKSEKLTASATLQGRSGCRSHHQLLFDGYLRALGPIIPKAAKKTGAPKNSAA
eukprot:s153_g11.t3